MRSRFSYCSAAFGTAALLLFAGDARSGEEGAPTIAPRSLPCFDRAIVVAYLHHLQDRVMEHWVIDEDSLADQRVVVRFRLADDGSLLTYKLVSWTSRRIANAADLAMRHAGPFGPIPDSATCVIGRSIEMQFENPY
jgi:hypothetical protein